MTWRHDKQQRRRMRWPFVVLLLLVIMCGCAAAYGYNRGRQTSEPSLNHETAKTNAPLSVSGRYLLNGTVTWSRGVEQQAGADSNQPFSQLATFDRSKYNAWTASLECPITSNVVSFASQVANLIFNCPSRFLSNATKYFNIYDLANNHTYDQSGEAGLAETRKNITDSGAQFFGTYDSSDTNNICEVVSLAVKVSDDSSGSLPVAFCGWQYFTRTPVESELAVMDRYAKVMPVFAFVEAGVEYRPNADDRQVSVGHQLVEHGADFVIINSPHWVQNTEAYNGKLIVYSMGNFIFDQLEKETNRSVSIDVAMKVETSPELQDWLLLGPGCSTYHDSCLELAEQKHLQKIQPKYTFGVVAGNNGYKVVTHKADVQTQKDIEERTNWSQTCQQLGYNQCQ